MGRPRADPRGDHIGDPSSNARRIDAVLPRDHLARRWRQPHRPLAHVRDRPILRAVVPTTGELQPVREPRPGRPFERTPTDYRRRPIPWEAAFLAGKAFVDYRRNRGTKSTTLPDFFIGAHAAVAGFELLTRDVSRYRTYFPTVPLIGPNI